MDYTGDTGETVDQIESVADAEHDDVAPDEIALEEDLHHEDVHHEIDDGDGETVDGEAVEHEAVGEESSTTRERNPAGAAALAKRVAMDRPTRIGVASLVFVALMFMFVFPTRSYLAQQRQVRDARHSVQVLRAQNEKLAREAKQLQTPSEIERLARSQFNMVVPGEQAYNVVPPEGSATTTTEP